MSHKCKEVRGGKGVKKQLAMSDCFLRKEPSAYIIKFPVPQ